MTFGDLVLDVVGAMAGLAIGLEVEVGMAVAAGATGAGRAVVFWFACPRGAAGASGFKKKRNTRRGTPWNCLPVVSYLASQV